MKNSQNNTPIDKNKLQSILNESKALTVQEAKKNNVNDIQVDVGSLSQGSILEKTINLKNNSSETTEASSSNLLRPERQDPSNLQQGKKDEQEEESKKEQNEVDTRKKSAKEPEKAAYKLAIHQLDVGQGDSALVLFKKYNTETASYQVYKSMLIDGGFSYNKESIEKYVQDQFKIEGRLPEAYINKKVSEVNKEIKKIKKRIKRLSNAIGKTHNDKTEARKKKLREGEEDKLEQITKKKLNALVVSHGDADHIMGIPQLPNTRANRQIPEIKAILQNASPVVDSLAKHVSYAESIRWPGKAGKKINGFTQCEVGGEAKTWKRLFGPKYKEEADGEKHPSIECVSSGAGGVSNENNNSLAFMIKSYGFSFFTAGDLEGAEEVLAVQRATKAFTREATEKALKEIIYKSKSMKSAVENARETVTDEAAYSVHKETGATKKASKDKLKDLITEEEVMENLKELLGGLTINPIDLSTDQKKEKYHAAIKTLDAKYPGALVVKPGHHGSGGASSTPTLKGLDSIVALNSNGLGYKHPAIATLERLEKYVTHTYMTNPPKTLEVDKIKFIKERKNKFTIAGDSETVLSAKDYKAVKGHLVTETREKLESAEEGSFTVSYQQKGEGSSVRQCRDYYHCYDGGLPALKNSLHSLFEGLTEANGLFEAKVKIEDIETSAKSRVTKEKLGNTNFLDMSFNHKTFKSLINKRDAMAEGDNVCYINANIRKDMISISIKNAEYGSITKEYTAIQKGGRPNINLLSRRVISESASMQLRSQPQQRISLAQ